MMEKKMRNSTLPSIALTAILTLMCGCSEKPTPPEKPEPKPIPHTILKEDVSETTSKTQVRQEILVDPGISEEDLKRVFLERYTEISKRGGFRYHSHPTVVAIFAFHSREHADGGQWSGTLLKTPNDMVPKVSILDTLYAPPMERFGFSEAERREMFTRSVQAEDRATSESYRRYPNPVDWKKQLDLVDKLTAAYKKDLARELKITPAQLKMIEVEGSEENWPLPK